MELRETNVEAARLLSGHETEIVLEERQSLRIETSPNGDEILNVECPAGKSWTARVIVEITETDA